MTELMKLKNMLNYIIVMIASPLIILLIASITFAHGPKGHHGDSFTALQAVQKGIVLYEKLIESGRLSESWGADLTDVEVSSMQNGSDRKVVVKLSRSKGEPKSVYIFFTENGEYKGSNFGEK